MGTTTVTGPVRTRSSRSSAAWPLGYAGKQWKSFVAEASASMHPAGTSAASHLPAWQRRGMSPFLPAF